MDGIINRVENLIKQGKFSPYSVHEIIVEEYLKHIIIEGKGIIFPEDSIKHTIIKNNACKHKNNK